MLLFISILIQSFSNFKFLYSSLYFRINQLSTYPPFLLSDSLIQYLLISTIYLGRLSLPPAILIPIHIKISIVNILYPSFHIIIVRILSHSPITNSITSKSSIPWLDYHSTLLAFRSIIFKNIFFHHSLSTSSQYMLLVLIIINQ